jgi:hypothetical protein
MPEFIQGYVEWLHKWQEFIGGLIGAASFMRIPGSEPLRCRALNG